MRRHDEIREDRITIETSRLVATVARRGYVSGLASLIDKATGSRDLGFGLDIVDFLLEPAAPDSKRPPEQYDFGPDNRHHGRIPKRYVEGPQICTRAEELPIERHDAADFVAIRQRFRWTDAYAPRERAGSIWEQTLVIPREARYVLASDRVTARNSSPALNLRIDLPGHIQHDQGREFEHVYLSYNEPAFLPSTEFVNDFPPDTRFRYIRPADERAIPSRIIRAYQVRDPRGEGGPWLAGMTLHPADVAEAWCHQRGYVCMIQEIGGRPTMFGDTFGACYILGWFGDVTEMESVYDRYRGSSGIDLTGPTARPDGFRLVPQAELSPVAGWDDVR